MHISPEKKAALQAKASDGRTRLGRGRKDGVRHSSDLARIIALPRRPSNPEQTEYSIEDTTNYLCHGEGILRSVQVQALHEIHDCNGGFVMARVGAGKFLISVLAFTLIECKRPLLLVPSALVKTTKRLIAEHRKNWRIRGDITVVGANTLSSAKNHDLLFQLNPDCIGVDECHMYKNVLTAGRAKRLARFMKANPHVPVVNLTGTPITKSVRDIGHLLRWSLKEGSPLPLADSVLFEWSKAIDRDELLPLPPGELERLMTPEDTGTPRTRAESAVSRRIVETPGVIATSGGFYGARLQFDPVHVPLPKVLTEALRRLEDRWEKPDGSPLSSPAQVASVARTLWLGFYWQDVTPAPDDWLEARRAWSACCRWIVTKSRAPLDTELQIRQVVQRGEYDRSIEDLGVDSIAEVLEQWLAVKDDHKPKTRCEWLDQSIMDAVAARAKNSGAIVWTANRYESVGLALEARGITYFGENGLDKDGRSCEAIPCGPVCLSVKANATGRNLQAWSSNLVLTLTPNAEVIEQLAGRTHRDGQQADCVTVEILNPIAETWDKLLHNARYAERNNRQEQKVLYADKTGVLLDKAKEKQWDSEI